MLSWALQPSACPGGGRISGCVPGAQCSRACAVGFALPAAQPPMRSRRQSPSELLPGLAARCSPSGARRALSPGRSSSFTVPGSLRASPPSWGPAPTPCQAFPPRGRLVQLLLLLDELSCPGDTRPGLSLAPRGGPPPWMPFVSLFLFSPSSYLDRSANSSHCSIPDVLSLILRPNS